MSKMVNLQLTPSQAEIVVSALNLIIKSRMGEMQSQGWEDLAHVSAPELFGLMFDNAELNQLKRVAEILDPIVQMLPDFDESIVSEKVEIDLRVSPTVQKTEDSNVISLNFGSRTRKE